MKKEIKIIVSIVSAVLLCAAAAAAIFYFREDLKKLFSSVVKKVKPEAPTYTPEEQEDFADI